MLPVSGAEQLNTSGAQPTRPMSSHSGAYSRLVRPAPSSDSGRNRFHRPSACASSFSSSMRATGCQRSPSATSRAKRASFGKTWACMNPSTRVIRSLVLGEGSKLMVCVLPSAIGQERGIAALFQVAVIVKRTEAEAARLVEQLGDATIDQRPVELGDARRRQVHQLLADGRDRAAGGKDNQPL